MSFVNPANLNQSVVRHSPSSVSFGVYTDDEVRQRSVCEITSSATYDALRNALPRGLYDPLLGPTSSSSSFDGNHACVTCGQVQSLCPGHFGHIELCVPLMHPLFFPKLLTLMRMKCLGCHEFRLARRQCQVYAAKLHLIDVGRAGEALSLDEELSGAARGASESLAGERRNGGRRADGTLDAEAKREAVLASAGAIDAVLSAKLALGPAPSRRPPPSGDDDDDDDDGGGGRSRRDADPARAIGATAGPQGLPILVREGVEVRELQRLQSQGAARSVQQNVHVPPERSEQEEQRRGECEDTQRVRDIGRGGKRGGRRR